MHEPGKPGRGVAVDRILHKFVEFLGISLQHFARQPTENEQCGRGHEKSPKEQESAFRFFCRFHFVGFGKPRNITFSNQMSRIPTSTPHKRSLRKVPSKLLTRSVL